MSNIAQDNLSAKLKKIREKRKHPSGIPLIPYPEIEEEIKVEDKKEDVKVEDKAVEDKKEEVKVEDKKEEVVETTGLRSYLYKKLVGWWWRK